MTYFYFFSSHCQTLPLLGIQPNELKLGRKPHAILVSDWLISKNSSPLKPLGEMNQNLVGRTLWIELCTCNKIKPHIFIELLTF
jgi:hypothetical protein